MVREFLAVGRFALLLSGFKLFVAFALLVLPVKPLTVVLFVFSTAVSYCSSVPSNVDNFGRVGGFSSASGFAAVPACGAGWLGTAVGALADGEPPCCNSRRCARSSVTSLKSLARSSLSVSFG